MFACPEKEAILCWGYLRDALNLLFSVRPSTEPDVEKVKRNDNHHYVADNGHLSRRNFINILIQIDIFAGGHSQESPLHRTKIT